MKMKAKANSKAIATVKGARQSGRTRPLWDALRADVREVIEARHYGVKAIATVVDRPVSQVYAWINGTVEPGAEFALRLAAWVRAEREGISLPKQTRGGESR